MCDYIVEQVHKSHDASVPYPIMHIQNRNMYISVSNNALCDMEQLHYEICELG